MWFYVVQPHAQGISVPYKSPIWARMLFFVNPFQDILYGISSKILTCPGYGWVSNQLGLGDRWPDGLSAIMPFITSYGHRSYNY